MDSGLHFLLWNDKPGDESLDRPREDQLFRIQRSENGQVVFTLSGRMDRENIAELDRLIQAESNGRRVVLNLKDLTLAGQEEIVFLARCEASGITLVNCAPYIRDWIARQRSER